MPVTDSQVGITPLVPSINVLDTITVSGAFAFGGRGNLGTLVEPTSWEIADQISWSHGKHTIRAGGEVERDRQNWQYAGVGIGSLTFTKFSDFLLGLPGCTPGTACSPANPGNTNGSTVSNIANSGSIVSATPPAGVDHSYRITALNAFVQDDYAVRSNLTLNLGVRWEFNGLVSDNGGLLTNVWPSLISVNNTPAYLGGSLGNSATCPNPNLAVGVTCAPGTLAGFVVPANFNFGAFPTPPVGGLYQNNQNIATQNKPSLHNFAPRLGMAWKPFSSDKFVFRAGGGFFYDRLGVTTYNKSTQTAIPYAVPYQQTGAANYFSTFAQPYAPGVLGWTPRWANFGTGGAGGALGTGKRRI